MKFLPALSLSSKIPKSYMSKKPEEEKLDLILTPNEVWIDQHGWTAYYAVMKIFATFGLARNRRRDNGSLCMFHFKELSNLCEVSNGIKRGNLAPNAFSARADPNIHPNIQLEPIGDAWILLKVGVS
ncbi:hypothetical protein Glove_242g130 [Diversispora epigaea]|uniref:Uncharacterized protein n=1 Tax=Diversispora epigaea TaxID=1348612 RepID=A0A397I9U6_9GLOM|nr:hypothetical protein Glove_242g130 [Diversispora epigaea]